MRLNSIRRRFHRLKKSVNWIGFAKWTGAAFFFAVLANMVLVATMEPLSVATTEFDIPNFPHGMGGERLV